MDIGWKLRVMSRLLHCGWSRAAAVMEEELTDGRNYARGDFLRFLFDCDPGEWVSVLNTDSCTMSHVVDGKPSGYSISLMNTADGRCALLVQFRHQVPEGTVREVAVTAIDFFAVDESPWIRGKILSAFPGALPLLTRDEAPV